MSTLEQTRPTQLQSWLLAARPKTLPAAITPVIVGAALAVREGSLEPLTALAALLSALLIQVGANFHNDLSDFKHGTDSDGRLGPTRVTSAGLLSPQAVERGTYVVFGLAACFGLYLVFRGGWPILVLGVAAILSALAYTAGPYPLGYHGLGDLFVFLFFGLAAVAGTYYVQSGHLSTLSLLAAIPMGALITNILVVNNIRDIDGDRLAGKRTTAVIFGRQAARAEWLVCAVVAYGVPPGLWLGMGLPVWVLLPFLSLPLAVRLARTVTTETAGPTLNRALAGTGQLVALYGILFAIGLAISG